MATSQTTDQKNIPSTNSIVKFEWLYMLLSTWFIIGIFADAWSHTHRPEIESFFTLPHLVMYTGAMVVSSLVLYYLFMNLTIGKPFNESLPRGYHPALYGIIIFMVAGVGDLFWHELFGVEENLEASFSPTHIGLMIGLTLLLATPFYSHWINGSDNTGSIFEQLPKIMSFTFLISALTVISQWANPFVVLYPILPLTFGNEAVGMLSFLLQTIFIMPLLLLTFKENILPVGSYTIALTVNMIFLQAMRYNFYFLFGVIFTGIVADYLLHRKDPDNIIPHFRQFAIIIPLSYFGLYFLTLLIMNSITWSVHLSIGAIVTSMALSGFLGFFILPPSRGKE